MSKLDYRTEYPPESREVVLARRIHDNRPAGVERGECGIVYNPISPMPSMRWTVRYVCGGTAARRKFRTISGPDLLELLRDACLNLGLDAEVEGVTRLPYDVNHLVWRWGSE